MNSRSAHILVAEDDKSVRLVVQQALARQGYTVQSSGTAAGLWKLIESGRGDVLISDIALPDGLSCEALSRPPSARLAASASPGRRRRHSPVSRREARSSADRARCKISLRRWPVSSAPT